MNPTLSLSYFLNYIRDYDGFVRRWGSSVRSDVLEDRLARAAAPRQVILAHSADPTSLAAARLGASWGGYPHVLTSVEYVADPDPIVLSLRSAARLTVAEWCLRCIRNGQ